MPLTEPQRRLIQLLARQAVREHLTPRPASDRAEPDTRQQRVLRKRAVNE